MRRWWWLLQAHILKTNVWKNNFLNLLIQSQQQTRQNSLQFLLCLLTFPTCVFFPLSTSFSTFNPADYTANSGTRQETWEGDGNEPAEGTGKENNRT